MTESGLDDHTKHLETHYINFMNLKVSHKQKTDPATNQTVISIPIAASPGQGNVNQSNNDFMPGSEIDSQAVYD